MAGSDRFFTNQDDLRWWWNGEELLVTSPRHNGWELSAWEAPEALLDEHRGFFGAKETIIEITEEGERL